MDHLAIAKDRIEDNAYCESTEAISLNYQAAIAHALIALVERLDKMMSYGYDTNGIEQAFLRVDA